MKLTTRRRPRVTLSLVDLLELVSAIALLVVPARVLHGFVTPQQYGVALVHLIQVAMFAGRLPSRRVWLYITFACGAAALATQVIDNVDTLATTDQTASGIVSNKLVEILMLVVPVFFVNIIRLSQLEDDDPLLAVSPDDGHSAAPYDNQKQSRMPSSVPRGQPPPVPRGHRPYGQD